VRDTLDCGSSGVGAPQGVLSRVWSNRSRLERVVHYSNLPACTARLTELVVIQVGVTLGVLSEQLSSMLIMMAIVTTVAAMPPFKWLYKDSRRDGENERQQRHRAGSAKITASDRATAEGC
jgi:hypothetical protein